jgi:DNA-binding MarR family transcriptional regulator
MANNTHVRGLSAWVAVVRTYQQCFETLTAHIKPLGLKLAQHDVLMNLLLPEPTQQVLAEKSFVTKSHMSAVLSDMAELG